MRPIILYYFLGLVGSGYACGGHDHEKEWTKEELAKLEEKWGFEVSKTEISVLLQASLSINALMIQGFSGHSMALDLLLI